METSIIIAVVGLIGGVVTAVTSILINRLNRKDAVEDKNTVSTNELSEQISSLKENIGDLKEMCVSSVRDKLRHYAGKYLACPEKASITAVKDWLDLADKYFENGGNSHIKNLYPLMEELLQKLEIEEQK